MEYVQGKTLDRLIPRYGMRLNEALKVVSRRPRPWQQLTPWALSIGISSRLVHPAFPSPRRQRDGVKGRGVSRSTVAKHRGVAPAKHLGHLLAERFFGDFRLRVDMS